MQDIVIQVREKCAAGFDLLDIFERFVETEMGRMRFDAYAVKYENVESLHRFDRCVGNEIEIGSVRKIIEPIRDHGELAVDDFERRDLEIFANAKWSVRVNGVRDQLRQSAAEVGGPEDVLEDALQIDPCDVVREDRHRSVSKIQWANIVQAKDVIDVAVRYEHGVKPFYFCPQRLLPEVDGCIDENFFVFMLDEYRDPKPFVARILRKACFAIARDRRNAGRCACAKEGKFHEG